MSVGSEQRISISYRRSDCQSQANGLHDGLKHRFTESRIFMDIDSIPPGADFEEHIRGEIEQCHVVLVLIGDEWLDPRPGTELRRIDEANDFIRLEIESSLAAEHVRVVPLLVEGARMPAPEELPASIRRLARLNAFELSDQRWSSDVERLTQQLRQIASPALPDSAVAAPTMSFADVDDEAIRYAVSVLPNTFKTKDLSEHPAVQATHTEVVQLRNYHTIIGRYLMRNRARLGLGEPARPADDRGSVWTKQAPLGMPVPKPRQPVSRAAAAGPTQRNVVAGVPPRGAGGGSSKSGWLMVVLPLVTCGLAAWVPPVWAAHQRRHDREFRNKMVALAAGLAVAFVVAAILIGTAPVDASGTPTGVGSNVGTAIVLLTIAAGLVVAILYRNPREVLPGTETSLARRDSREQYRRLVQTDRPLALSMFVGRPDVARDYDDGGLLDLNSLSAEALAVHGGLSREEAVQVVEVRTRLGRFSDFSEVTAYVDLPEPTAARLKDLAVLV